MLLEILGVIILGIVLFVFPIKGLRFGGIMLFIFACCIGFIVFIGMLLGIGIDLWNMLKTMA